MKIFAAIIVSLVLTCATRPATATRAVAGRKTSDFINTSCLHTPYPILCHTSLSCHAKEIGTDSELLARTALAVALESAVQTFSMLVKMADSGGSSEETMRDCVKEVSQSVRKIERSLAEMKRLKRPGFAVKIRNVQNWISDSVTDDDRCTQALSIYNDTAAVRERINNVAHLTINALALIRLESTAFAGGKNIEFVRSSCEATLYPNICYAALSVYASEIGANPELLAHKAIILTLNHLESTISMLVKEAETPDLTPRQNMTILTCQEVSNNSVFYMQTSLKAFQTIKQQKGPNLKYATGKITIGLTAVVSGYDWCIMELDETPGMNRKVKMAVTERIRKVDPFAPIAIDLVEGFVALLPRT